MSRVYNVLTGVARPAAPAVADASDEMEWETNEDAPFVEVGGPSGPIFSTPVVASTVAPAVATRAVQLEKPPETQGDTARLFPRLAPTPNIPAYLSVQFHDISVQKDKLAADGPDSSLVALHFPEHAVSAEYRVLRDELRNQLPEASSRILMFSAAVSEAGTTTVMLNLALTLAREGKTRVLAIDANVNRSAIAQRLAIKPAPGLGDVLAGQVPLAWALQSSPLPNLQALAAGVRTDATAATMSRDFPKLLTQLRQWFDWVLVDAGEWGVLPERDAISPAADAVYLVTRDGDAARPEFLGLRGRVKEAGGLLRGYIATRA